MPLPGNIEFDKVRFQSGVFIVTGKKATRASVAAEYAKAPVGSMYINAADTGGTGRIYVKVTETGGASGTAGDWEKVTTSAAD